MSAQDTTLLEKTRELLRNTEHTYLEIYNATGLSPYWLTGVSTGRVPDPSVNRVQKLYEFLTGKPLTV